MPTAQDPRADVDLGSLAIVVPAFCAAAWLPRTIPKLVTAVERSPWRGRTRLIVVDDGSTDGTAAVASDLPVEFLEVISQPNLGRFDARLAGLRAAEGAGFVMLCDTRVEVDESALVFVAEHVRAGALVWNAHVEIDPATPYPLLWEAISNVAWREYFRNPRTTSYGISDFDRYPKGTTCFFAPASLLREAFASFESGYDDLKNANDDTTIIRWIARRERIWISPSFRCTYHGRETFVTFLRHSFHRGIVFVDGYLRQGTRYAVPIIAFLAMTPVALWLFLRFPAPTAVLALVTLLMLGITVRLLGARTRAALAFTYLLPVFAVFYGAGIWSGVFLRLVSSARRGRPS